MENENITPISSRLPAGTDEAPGEQAGRGDLDRKLADSAPMNYYLNLWLARDRLADPAGSKDRSDR